MGWVVNDTPRPLYARETDAVPIVSEVRWAPRAVWKIYPTPGFDPRTNQPVVGRYTD